jgi:outer membrane protein TolC
MTLATIAVNLMLAATPAEGPAGAREPLSLEEALARANAQNPELRALRERSNASAAHAEAIRRQKLPRLTLETIAERTDNPASAFAHKLNAGRIAAPDFDPVRLNSPGATSHLEGSIGISAPIDLFGRVDLAADAESARHRASAEVVREAESEIGFQVVAAYLEWRFARAAAKATEAATHAVKSREAITQARFEEGAALQSDVLRARARRREREAGLALRQSDCEVAEASLRRLIGAPDDARFETIEVSVGGTGDTPLEVWKARADASPGLQAARARRDEAAFAIRGEEKSALPELAAEARLRHDRNSRGARSSWSLGALLRWNVLDAGRGKRIAAASALERAAAEGERAARARVQFEVEAAFSRSRAANDRRIAAKGGAEEGREALRVVRERRLQGLATLTDELETEAAAFAAELEEIDAVRHVALAEAALRRVAGLSHWSTIQ